MGKYKEMETVQDTVNQYNTETKAAFDEFIKHQKQSSTLWRGLTGPSITRHLYEKTKKIRLIQETLDEMKSEFIKIQFQEIIHFCIIGLIQINPEYKELAFNLELDLVETLYKTEMQKIKNLMEIKNHDYGEAWRDMRIGSFVDLILTKLHRIGQIEKNNGVTIISEGIDANYMDIANYCIFALIKINEGSDPMI
jgi:uncharacterized protein YukE